ncbi:hypothetical protein PG994_004733 [Apiospora phragmitis]|uniref:Uncharacterized protein n=1 Tax=Apiospora phragmitis TaxID=2905665 RepID=A0ABR1VV99_9PEZI
MVSDSCLSPGKENLPDQSATCEAAGACAGAVTVRSALALSRATVTGGAAAKQGWYPSRVKNVITTFRGEAVILSPSHTPGSTAAKLTESIPPSSFHDRHDLHETRPTPTQIYRRQQQQQPRLSHAQQTQTPPPSVPEQTTTPSSHHRALRRTPRFTATPSPKPQDPSAQQPSSARVTLTLGPQGKFVLADQQQPQSGQPQTRTRPRPARRQLSQDLSSEDDEDHEPSPRAPSQYHRDNTNPQGPGLPDPHPAVRISKRTHSAILYALEETLRGPKELSSDWVEELASMSDLLGGGGIATTNGHGASSSRPVPARAPVGSPSSGIRGPRMIMQERQAREAARKEERERQEREHAENEARMLEEARRREQERKAAAGGGLGTIPADPNVTRRPTGTAAGSGRVPTNTGTRTGDLLGGAEVETPRRHHRTSSGAAPAQATGAPPGGATAGGAPKAQQGTGSDSLTAIGRGRNSFPHAFERWETLSAHWEGLTSFWIRRLQQNSEEINQDPLSQQLSRQVTDLSSAGANLFHAVVELQRLRASSERKFQRWFFETRAEMERNQEVTAMLEAALEEERRSRAEAIREAAENAQGSSKVQRQLSEMRKELQISKEEARRAWEELGRREQEERDRTASLQLGHPTIVGGVQVVPMTQGVSRHNSQRDPQQYGQPDPSDYSRGQASRPEYTQAPAVQPVATSAGEVPYQQPAGVHHQDSYGSEGTFSEEEYETPATQPGAPYPPSTGAQQPDYTGAGFSSSTWEQMPRHHHPTRLSDVIEEDDERSRTSASHSQVSRG